jgi:hypothetical protein
MPAPGTVWIANSWDIDAWAADTWADAVEQAFDPTNYPTLFLDDSTPVPASASYRGGAAYNSTTGERYVALWPASNRVYYLAGFAHRMDGALLIDPAGTESLDHFGISTTERGEVITSILGREIVLNGLPLRYDGKLCVTDQN